MRLFDALPAWVFKVYKSALDRLFHHRRQSSLVPRPSHSGSPSSPRMKSESSVSGSGDHSVLSYSTHPPPLGHMNMHQDMRYAPTQPGSGMPLMQSPYYGGYPGAAQMPNRGHQKKISFPCRSVTTLLHSLPLSIGPESSPNLTTANAFYLCWKPQPGHK